MSIERNSIRVRGGHRPKRQVSLASSRMVDLGQDMGDRQAVLEVMERRLVDLAAMVVSAKVKISLRIHLMEQVMEATVVEHKLALAAVINHQRA
jgi:hypothetical protein